MFICSTHDKIVSDNFSLSFCILTCSFIIYDVLCWFSRCFFSLFKLQMQSDNLFLFNGTWKQYEVINIPNMMMFAAKWALSLSLAPTTDKHNKARNFLNSLSTKATLASFSEYLLIAFVVWIRRRQTKTPFSWFGWKIPSIHSFEPWRQPRSIFISFHEWNT